MVNRNFIFLILLAGCSSADDEVIEKKVLMSYTEELKGASCANGGIKLSSGIDLNDNTVLDSNEITTTKYVCVPDLPTGYKSSKVTTGSINYTESTCPNGGIEILVGLESANGSSGDYPIIFKYTYCHDKDGIYEMARMIKLPEVDIKSDTTISEATYFQNFNFSDFEQFDWVQFSFEYDLDDQGLIGKVQLFNKNDGVLINGSAIQFNGPGGGYAASVASFKDGFPHQEINLAVSTIVNNKDFRVLVRTGFLEFKNASLK